MAAPISHEVAAGIAGAAFTVATAGASAQGELLVAAFSGGMLAPPIDFMESHILR